MSLAERKRYKYPCYVIKRKPFASLGSGRKLNMFLFISNVTHKSVLMVPECTDGPTRGPGCRYLLYNNSFGVSISIGEVYFHKLRSKM